MTTGRRGMRNGWWYCRSTPISCSTGAAGVSDRFAFDQIFGAPGRHSLVTISEPSLAVHRLLRSSGQEGMVDLADTSKPRRPAGGGE